jgi:hypothetical protein
VARTPNRGDTLLAAALDGFATHGCEATTVAELAGGGCDFVGGHAVTAYGDRLSFSDALWRP